MRVLFLKDILFTNKAYLEKKNCFLNSDYFLSGRISLSWIKYAFNFLQQYCFKTSSNFKLKIIVMICITSTSYLRHQGILLKVFT